MTKCESCGVLMTSLSEFGGMKKDSRYCRKCTYENGTIRPKHEVQENLIQYYMKVKKFDRREAEAYVEEIMARAPAWQ